MSWIVAGVVLLAAEAPVPGVFLMWLGIAALGTGLATLAFAIPLGAEVGVFAALAAVSVAIGWRLRRPRVRLVNTPQSGLVGRPAIALGFAGPEGRVRVGDTDWPARLVPHASLPADRLLRVVGLDGMTLLVDRRAGPD